ncbi:MAG TPA: response regulator, partial [Candidatus Acidoferrales bacterium]|nr:response regulator [Candidatus Acidoferrales bacterium]
RIDDFVQVDVRDSGPGIPPEEQKRIFEAFYRLSQTAKAPEGTGLGLAITQRLVELHGGHLGIENLPGSGSCFYFTLPVGSTLHTPRVQEVGRRLSTDRNPRVLVVEDSPTAAALLESHLLAAGYDVTLCHEPDQAAELAADLQPAAVTIDIVMKPVNGWEVLAALKSNPRTSEIPVIVVTIVDQPSTGALLGADEYIVKPVEGSVLLAAVERCLKRAGEASPRSILVVEDHAPTREFIVESLSKRGYRVETAADGGQARARVAKELPRLIILDLILPVVSGFELLAEWRADSRTVDLPVFVLTSKDLTPDESEYIRKNSSALFQKHEPWREALFRHLRRAVPAELMERT